MFSINKAALDPSKYNNTTFWNEIREKNSKLKDCIEQVCNDVIATKNYDIYREVASQSEYQFPPLNTLLNDPRFSNSDLTLIKKAIDKARLPVILDPSLYHNEYFLTQCVGQGILPETLKLAVEYALEDGEGGTCQLSDDGPVYRFPYQVSFLTCLKELLDPYHNEIDIDEVHGWIKGSLRDKKQENYIQKNKELREEVMSLLGDLYNKTHRLGKFPEALAVVNDMIFTIEQEASKYFNEKKPTTWELVRFQTKCLSKISTALNDPELAKHRSVFGETLGAFFAGLKNFFIACINNCSRSTQKMDLWNTKTDSMKVVLKLQADFTELSKTFTEKLDSPPNEQHATGPSHGSE